MTETEPTTIPRGRLPLENNIGWCDVTTNPGIGCRGCELGDDCYAKFDTPARVLRAGKWPGYEGKPTETFGKNRVFVPTRSGLTKLRAWNKLCICGHCHLTHPVEALFDDHVCIKKGVCPSCDGKLRRIRAFCDSNSDWMDWPTEILAAALEEIRNAPNVDVILLTKWPELWRERMRAAIDHIGATYSKTDTDTVGFVDSWMNGHPPAHVITLTSVLGNANDEKRIKGILALPSVTRGFSCEPLWASVTLDAIVKNEPADAIGWIIVGCDSSQRHKGWENYEANARQIIAQGRAAGVAVYHKQMPIRPATGGQSGRVSLNPAEWPAEFQVREFYRPVVTA